MGQTDGGGSAARATGETGLFVLRSPTQTVYTTQLAKHSPQQAAKVVLFAESHIAVTKATIGQY